LLSTSGGKELTIMTLSSQAKYGSSFSLFINSLLMRSSFAGNEDQIIAGRFINGTNV
jgi:hypothetical protein